MESLVYGLVTASTTMAGGLWIASRPNTWLTAKRLAGLMALGAGLLMAVLLFELLPESLEHGGPNAFVFMFAGILTVLLFERYVTPRLGFLAPADHAHDHHHDDCHDHARHGENHDHVHVHGHGHGPLLSHGAACSALGCLLVCTFFDGFAMAAGFSLGASIGFVIAVGLMLHMLPEGILASTVVLASGNSATVARRAAVATGVAFLLGMLAHLALGGALGALAFALPLAAGVLVYVVFVQLVPSALQSKAGVPLLVVGAALFAVMERLIPHAH